MQNWLAEAEEQFEYTLDSLGRLEMLAFRVMMLPKVWLPILVIVAVVVVYVFIVFAALGFALTMRGLMEVIDYYRQIGR